MYLLTKIGADTAENEQHFTEILPIGRRMADARWLGRGRLAAVFVAGKVGFARHGRQAWPPPRGGPTSRSQ